MYNQFFVILFMIRVDRFGLFEAKKQIWPFLKLVGLENFYNLLSSWPYFRSRKVSIVKSKMLPFLKQRLAFVSYKHLATLFMISFIIICMCYGNREGISC